MLWAWGEDVGYQNPFKRPMTYHRRDFCIFMLYKIDRVSSLRYGNGLLPVALKSDATVSEMTAMLYNRHMSRQSPE
jgi:hypothetical protein